MITEFILNRIHCNQCLTAYYFFRVVFRYRRSCLLLALLQDSLHSGNGTFGTLCENSVQRTVGIFSVPDPLSQSQALKKPFLLPVPVPQLCNLHHPPQESRNLPNVVVAEEKSVIPRKRNLLAFLLNSRRKLGSR